MKSLLLGIATAGILLVSTSSADAQFRPRRSNSYSSSYPAYNYYNYGASSSYGFGYPTSSYPGYNHYYDSFPGSVSRTYSYPSYSNWGAVTSNYSYPTYPSTYSSGTVYPASGVYSPGVWNSYYYPGTSSYNPSFYPGTFVNPSGYYWPSQR